MNTSPRQPALSKRLTLVASLVRDGAVAADIGTDHAQLPIFLVSTGQCPRVIACDLRRGPLDLARAAVKAARLCDQIDTRLCDGLDGVASHEADDIVLAGMGGQLISDIIGRTAWLKDGSKRLILQPMTYAELLRGFLWEQGFSLLTERAVRDGRYLYGAMQAVYTGQIYKATPLECLLGELPQGGHLERQLLERTAKRLYKESDGLHRSTDPDASSRAGSLRHLADGVIQAAEAMHEAAE